jgi:signal transduction histidine kinase
MASGIASGGSELPPLRVLRRRIAKRAAPERCVPLLVLRLPELERIAWRKGMGAARRVERAAAHAFRVAARRIVRANDALAHDDGSDCFVIAMLHVPREGHGFDAVGCRSALDRVTSALSQRTKRRIESGWWALERLGHVRELQRAVSDALERAARERERYEFLATLSHELRTPLCSIRGYLETALESGSDVRRTRRSLLTAQRETLRLGRIVDGMLEFSLLDLSPSLPAVRTCNVRDQIIAAVEALEPAASRRRTTLQAEVPRPVLARIDGDNFAHALLNLIDNAIVHGKAGGTVRITSRCTEACVEIAIDGDGPWLPASAARGHGLGLTIARTIAERAGGEVRHEHSSSGGVCALLRLPLARCEAEVAGSAS